MKEKNLEFIKEFSKITIRGVCEELSVDRSNLLTGKSSAAKTEAVKNKILEKMKKLEESIL